MTRGAQIEIVYMEQLDFYGGSLPIVQANIYLTKRVYSKDEMRQIKQDVKVAIREEIGDRRRFKKIIRFW